MDKTSQLTIKNLTMDFTNEEVTTRVLDGISLEVYQNEFVVVLQGSAGLRMDGEDAPLVLRPGDYVVIPAHVRHRVEWTDPSGYTIWLAVFYR